MSAPARDDPALVNLRWYLDALERFELEVALECFADDVEYHHHPFGEGGHPDHDDDRDWHVARGKDELEALWRFRGQDPIIHHVTAFARDGDTCFNEGYATMGDGDEVLSTWLSIFTVDSSHRIVRYLSYLAPVPLPVFGQLAPDH